MKKAFLIYTLYIWGKTLYGLLLYPYHTIWQIRRRPVLLPVFFSPLLSLIFLFMLGRIAAILIDVYDVQRMIIALILGAILFAITMWQILLFYFLINFLLIRSMNMPKKQ